MKQTGNGHMNERIKELAQAAGYNKIFYNDTKAKARLEKFAELIVSECAAYLNGAMEVHNQSEQDLCDLAARKIKEHFNE